MGFIQPCFIRKNTPELRKKLKELGYKDYGNLRYYGEPIIIYCNNNHFFTSPFVLEGEQYRGKYDNFIDCSDNEELFLALVAMRDDTDINRWFKDLETNELFICTKHSIYDMATPEDLEEYGDWIGIGMCKYQIATVEEIIEHFKK